MGGGMTQNLSGLKTGRDTVLSYSLRQWPTTSKCEWIVTYEYQQDGQPKGNVIDGFYVPKSGSWQPFSVTFKPHASSGQIQFGVGCTDNNGASDEYLIGVDSISMTEGPSS